MKRLRYVGYVTNLLEVWTKAGVSMIFTSVPIVKIGIAIVVWVSNHILIVNAIIVTHVNNEDTYRSVHVSYFFMF
jgi:hypothetical protein